MAIPDYQTIMLPLLQYASDGQMHSVHEVVNTLSKQFQLTNEDESVLLPSGQQPVFYNRVGWARTYLKKAGLLDSPKRGYFVITERGKEVLRNNPTRIDNTYLQQFSEFVEFRKRNSSTNDDHIVEQEADDLTPIEAMEEAYQKVRTDLVDEVLNAVINSSAGFFEKLVVELLVKMGYGGSKRDAARAVGRSGDEGIDGIIDEDKLGLDTIYIQAKKWKESSTVGRPEIQKFVGALQGRRAKKGIFITTTNYSNEAKTYVQNIDTKVVLIDGERLADLMIDNNVGVSEQTSYEIKGLDTDYFGDLIETP